MSSLIRHALLWAKHGLAFMTCYYKWDHTVRLPITQFIQTEANHVGCTAGLGECWEC